MDEKGERLTMSEKVVPGLARLSLSSPHDSSGSVNVYTVMSRDGLRLIDCGWNAPEVYTALIDGLQQLGLRVSDIREILITHNHPDHIGLAERLVQETGARVLLHRLDAALTWTQAPERQRMLVEMKQWLNINGMPQDEWDIITHGMSRRPFRVPTFRPDRLLEGGEVLDWSPFRFEVLWTPGHAAGLVCLYEPQQQLLLSSDHVLERTSPHI
jgi:glyoxylase-like metal-dependent hydrolase (beta-lactamase superfamily II)